MKKETFSENQLVRAFLNGEEKALTPLIRVTQSRIYGYILKKTDDIETAKDLSQDTYIKIIQQLKLRKYKDKGKFISWALRIAHNNIIDWFRVKKRLAKYEKIGKLDLIEMLESRILNEERVMIKSEVFDMVRQLVVQLPEKQEEIIIKRYYWGLTFSEIAEESCISINTALGRARYAMQNMRKYIERDKIDLFKN